MNYFTEICRYVAAETHEILNKCTPRLMETRIIPTSFHRPGFLPLMWSSGSRSGILQQACCNKYLQLIPGADGLVWRSSPALFYWLRLTLKRNDLQASTRLIARSDFDEGALHLSSDQFLLSWRDRIIRWREHSSGGVLKHSCRHSLIREMSERIYAQTGWVESLLTCK